MHVISEKKLREFWNERPEAESSLRAWHRVVERADWNSFGMMREVYPSADQVGRCTVFNIGGNKFRLIVTINFKYKRVYIRNVLTHAEYSTGEWKDGCK